MKRFLLYAFLLSTLGGAGGGYYVYVNGPQFADLVPISKGSESYSQLLKINRQLVGDLKRVSEQNLQLQEVNLMFMGLMEDSKDKLNAAKLIVRNRADGTVRGADFSKELSVAERSLFITAAYDMHQSDVLEWVQNQPNWDKGLSKDDAKKINPKRYQGKDLKFWRDKYYSIKAHHHEDLHDYEDLYAVSQSKLNMLLAWYWNDKKYLSKVDFSHLDQDWIDGYNAHLKKAPKVEAHLFRSEVDTVNR